MQVVYLLSFLILAGPCFGLSEDRLKAAKSDISALYGRNDQLIARAVRLIFHDCVSPACDGCYNFDDESNNGLDDIVRDLDEVFVGRFDADMSRADFWVLAAITAIEKSAGDAVKEGSDTFVPNIKFETGRVDCPTSPRSNEVQEFPSADMDSEEMFGYMESHFGFTKRQIVALMGAHTLGTNHPDQSGYEGPFVNHQETLFDNQYYKDMVECEIQWFSEYLPETDEHQWMGGDEYGTDYGTRLNTDVALVIDLTLEDESPTCDPVSSCPVAETYGIVEEYAKDGELWVRDFVEVFEALVSRGL